MNCWTESCSYLTTFWSNMHVLPNRLMSGSLQVCEPNSAVELPPAGLHVALVAPYGSAGKSESCNKRRICRGYNPIQNCYASYG